MEALNELVKSGKVRAIGASAMYAYQFHNMQVVAKRTWLDSFLHNAKSLQSSL